MAITCKWTVNINLHHISFNKQNQKVRAKFISLIRFFYSFFIEKNYDSDYQPIMPVYLPNAA